MKDIKQYFSEAKVDKRETDSDTVVKKKDEEKETVARKKRKRVKIRISRTNSKESVCNIIDNKDDTIDKTPSPFAKLINQVTIPYDENLESSSTDLNIQNDIKKNSQLAIEMNGNRSRKLKKNLVQEISMENKISKKQLSKKIVLSVVDSSSDDMEDVKNENVSIDDTREPEETNAFQVLMNRNKPIQYKSQMQQSLDDTENYEESDYIKAKKSKRKEKIVALADKRGYSNRKQAEAKESEKIEQAIEDRMRFYKSDVKNDGSNTLEIKNSKQLSGSLLDYFSKSSLELVEKDINSVSTFTVKADVHRTDASCIESKLKIIPNKIYSNEKCSKLDLSLAEVDDIHVIASETLVSPQAVKQNQTRVKPRWSLRIKLHSSDEKDSSIDTDEEIFVFQSKSRSNMKYPNNSRKTTDIHMEEKPTDVYLKDNHTLIKMKMRNKKKEALIKDQKNSDSLNTLKDEIIYDNENSNICPKDLNKTGKKRQNVNDITDTVVTINSETDTETIKEKYIKRKSNEKLAPLFIKRCKLDSTVVAARRLFLQSDIIDDENKNTHQKINCNSIPILQFPVISHITQLENKPTLAKTEIKSKFPFKIKENYLPSINVNNYKCITNYKEHRKSIETINEPVKENFDQVLSKIEERCPDTQKMWKVISAIIGESKKKPASRLRSKKANLLEKKEKLTKNNNEEHESHNYTWTYKYRPRNADDIVGNEEAAGKLKDWLSSWRVTKEDISSGDEFYSSDSCSCSYNNENNQMAVLLGPHGSGKSACVYAVAEELGYSILEVNASSRRTGKRILKELEEATKSHRIKEDKHKSLFEQRIKEMPKNSQNSLILLEDIDIIFEEDEGFISAAYQLASNTKRPIIMTCRDKCPHLSKMAPQLKKIYFQGVKGSRASALLELISLAETGYRLPSNCLVNLLQVGDLRRALLQLQYLLLSGPPVLSEQSTIMKPLLWQDMQCYLYKPMIKLSKRNKTKTDKNIKKSHNRIDNTVILNNLVNNLDGLSLVSSLIDIEDIALNIVEIKEQSNLSLAENISLYSASQNLKKDIASYISNIILYKNFDTNKQTQDQNNIILRKQLNQGVDVALSHVMPTCLDRRIMTVDYLPAIRTICRAEEARSNANYKRGNRFFHYLHSLKVPTISMKPNILAAACRMLQEKIDKNMHASISVTTD